MGPRARDLSDATLHHDVTAGSVWKDPIEWLPQHTRFIDALVRALADESFAKNQPTVRVSVTTLTTYFEFKVRRKPHICAFVSATSKNAYNSTNLGRPGLQIAVVLNDVTFAEISKIVVGLLKEDMA